MLRLFVIISLFFVSFCKIQNEYYSMEEANSKVAVAFFFMDAVCGVSHSWFSWLPDNVRAEDVDRCVRDIYIVSCAAWAGPDPSPLTCRGIERK